MTNILGDFVKDTSLVILARGMSLMILIKGMSLMILVKGMSLMILIRGMSLVKGTSMDDSGQGHDKAFGAYGPWAIRRMP